MLTSLGKNYTIHFIGIGGIGMSGIAEILHSFGFKIQGSDKSINYNTNRLKDLGIKIFDNHEKQNINEVQAVVISSAIKENNPELIAAREKKISILHRSQMLAEIVKNKTSISITGTHGKTTTTSMMASLLKYAQFDPTVVNGGIINEFNSNALLGKSDWAVIEADESDGSFVNFQSSVAIITNIDPEHMENFDNNFDKLYNSFETFLNNIPFYGFAVIGIDNKNSEKLALNSNKRVITYATDNSNADVVASDIRFDANGTTFNVVFNTSYIEKKEILSKRCNDENVVKLPVILKDIYMPIMGKHNVQNALAVIITAKELCIDDATIREALRSFQGVKRRFSTIYNYDDVRIIDDYAHHPLEIISVIESAKQACSGKVYAIVEPHRYSRLKNLFNEFSTCFKGVEKVFVEKVYEAGESPNGYDSKTLCDEINSNGISADLLQNIDCLDKYLRSVISKNDMIIFMGAGNITNIAKDSASMWQKNPPQINDLQIKTIA